MKQVYRMDGRLCTEGALDFSWLNDGPAGNHGFLGTKDGHFRFEDGTPVRFWGVNITGAGAMPEKDAAEVMAERIAKAGVNLVRLHYADANSNLSLIDYSKGNSRHLHEENLNRLDYLVYQLKKRGIYIHIDLFAGRSFLPGDDLDYPDDLDFSPIKQINIFNRRLIELQMEFAQNYLTHLNPYTGLRYVDEPAVAVVQVMNENSIFWNKYKERTPSYLKELDIRFGQWLLAKYMTREGLAKAWTNDEGECGLMDGEDPAKGTVIRPILDEGGQNSTRWNDPWVGITCPARYADHVEFLLGVQLDFSRRMVDFLRSIGVKCAINMSNHSKGPADNLGITSFEDVTEDNAYFNHPLDFDGTSFEYNGDIMIHRDPRETLIKVFRHNLLTRLSVDRMADRPFIVGEWNDCYPTGYYAEAMFMMACYASLQDWDGMMLYSYSHFAKLDEMHGKQLKGCWNVYDDPATFGQIGMAAAIFRLGWVKAARNVVEVAYSEADRRMLDYNWEAPFGYLPYVSRTATRLFSQSYEGDADCVLASGMTPCGDYTKAKHAIVYSRSPYADISHRVRAVEAFLAYHKKAPHVLTLEDGSVMEQDYANLSRIVDHAMKDWGLLSSKEGLTQAEDAIISDTGEITFSFGKGSFSVNAPLVRGYAGRPDEVMDFGLFDLKLKNDDLTVHLISLDGKELEQSRHMLLTAIGSCENTNMVWKGNRLIDEGTAPLWVDQAEGVLRAHQSMALYPLDAQGVRMQTLKMDAEGVLALDGSMNTLYFEIEVP